MLIRIQRCQNGARVGDKFNGDRVYEFDEDNLEGLRSMLFDILDLLAPNNSRHAKYRIYIKLGHGDKYLCKKRNCEICKDMR